MAERQVVKKLPPPNRKRRKPEAARVEDILKQANLWSMVLFFIFWAIAKLKRAPHWELAEDELGEYSEVVAEAVNRNLPDEWLEPYNERLKQGAPLMAAITATAAIIAERVAKDRAVTAQNAGARTDARHGGGRGDYPTAGASTPMGDQ